MGSSPKHDNIQAAAAKLAEQARHAAEEGDRWFVRLASDLEVLGVWARDEAQIVAESFTAALNTTLEVTRKIKGTRQARQNSASQNRPPSVSTVIEVGEPVLPDSPLSESSSPRPSKQIDLLPATYGAATSNDAGDDAGRDGSEAGHAPGVLPVLQALERVVGEHTKSGQHNLDNDSRFWGLIQLLHLLKPPEPEPEAEAANESSTPRLEES